MRVLCRLALQVACREIVAIPFFRHNALQGSTGACEVRSPISMGVGATSEEVTDGSQALAPENYCCASFILFTGFSASYSIQSFVCPPLIIDSTSGPTTSNAKLYPSLCSCSSIGN